MSTMSAGGPRNGPVQTPEDNAWLFTAEEVAETPSRLGGLPREAEARVIAKSAKFMQECGREIHIPQLTISVAMKFFQRFYMLESMLVHHPPLVAAACLFLSCKVQETHKRLKDIIFWTVKVRTRHTADFPDGMDLLEDSPGYYEEKTNILDKEREVLRVLNFDLTVDHPYKHIWTLAKAFLGNVDGHKAVTQAAWNLINDSFRTLVHVQYDAREIATAALFLSAKLHAFPLNDGTTRDPGSGKRQLAWHELFKVDLHRIQDICNTLLDMYEPVGDRAKTLENGAGVLESLPPSHPLATPSSALKRLKTEPPSMR